MKRKITLYNQCLLIASPFFALFLLLSMTGTLSAKFEPVASWGWTIPQNVTNNLGDSRLQTAFTGPQDNLYMFWIDDSIYPFVPQLLYAERSPQDTWSPDEVVPGVPDGGRPPVGLVTEDGIVHVVNVYGSSLLYNSKAIGASWSPVITVDVSYGGDLSPVLSMGSKDNLHIVWGTNHYMRAGTADWTQVATDTIGYSVAIDKYDVLHSVWTENGEIYYATQKPYQPRSPSTNVSNNLTSSDLPSIALDAVGRVHVAWRDLDAPNNYGIFYSAKQGSQWSKSTNVTTVAENADENYQLAVSTSGTPHVLWRSYVGLYFYTTLEHGTWTASESALPNLEVAADGDVHEFDSGEHLFKSPGSANWTHSNFDVAYGNRTWKQFVAGTRHQAFALWSEQQPGMDTSDIYYTRFYSLALTSVSPLTITNPITTPLNIAGSGFITTTRVILYGGDGPYEIDPRSITATPNSLQITLPPSLYSAMYQLEVANADGPAVLTAVDQIAVISTAPVINDVIYYRPPDFSEASVRILGYNFFPPMLVEIDGSLVDYNFEDSTEISFSLPNPISGHLYHIVVTNTGPVSSQSTFDLVAPTIPQIFLPALHSKSPS